MIKYEVTVDGVGNKFWKVNGKFHREDGPAIEGADGFKSWYINNELHREDGPAIEGADGRKEWYINNELHREDGPAIEYADGSNDWYINGNRMTEQEFNEGVPNNKILADTMKMLDDTRQLYYAERARVVDLSIVIIQMQNRLNVLEAECFGNPK